MNMSDYLENKLIDHLFRAVPFTAPVNNYIGLCTSAPNDASIGTEVSGVGYVRQPVANLPVNWFSTQGTTDSTSNGTSGTTGNVLAIQWLAVTWTATITHVIVMDSLVAGNLLYWGVLDAPKVVNLGDNVIFTSNNFRVQIDN